MDSCTKEYVATLSTIEYMRARSRPSQIHLPERNETDTSTKNTVLRNDVARRCQVVDRRDHHTCAPLRPLSLPYARLGSTCCQSHILSMSTTTSGPQGKAYLLGHATDTLHLHDVRHVEAFDCTHCAVHDLVVSLARSREKSSELGFAARPGILCESPPREQTIRIMLTIGLCIAREREAAR